MAAHTPGTLSGDTSLVLPEFDAPPSDPLALLREWLDSAALRGVREPYAAVLATADGGGRPSTRVVLAKEFDGRGLVFAGSRSSRKGVELAGRPWASMAFYWRETLQQLTLAGPVETLTPEESDRIFAARPAAARAASGASRQSRPLTDETGLRDRANALLEDPEAIRRPEDWTGYRLLPLSLEFWYGSPDRLHRRLRYDRTDATNSTWTWQRLQP
ncbi:phenazine biosynthesis protein [Streptomyces sp. 150FB]|uniref:phenazine biosynthesis FMN-dependent oxidase PhzG n=1 Tax=Streptomyces sp. 150FB TaxID=1576605 RepID=UPI0005896210|nr:phenazine biosynthesis FMN-dependent oxidase PhzG [Streptomyces sp. 150FB]KIF73246.1 phenazine biosynthesis protein [Streptomyces sp. 150FB]